MILEIDIDYYNPDFMKKISNNIDLNRVYCVRFKGEINCFFNYYIQHKFNIKTNIYASDRYSTATAVGIQAITYGFDYITTAFCGRDGSFGTTTLEEILTFAKVIMGGQVEGEIYLLSQIAQQYERLTNNKIPNNKPIIGINIFKYESGVHAAGIEKNPITYEPFEPKLIGMQRMLVLGKHSGKNSILTKLKVLNIDNNYSVDQIINILNQVKNKSILNKMEVSDKDFIDICIAEKRQHNV